MLLIAESGFGEIRLPKRISNGLVLQRDADLSIWGWVDQGEKIRLEFLGKTYQAIADDHGNCLLPALIQDWRSKWNVGNFPFLIVQLPNFMAPKDQPSGSNWACLREAQLKTLSLPNTGMAVAIDLGDWNDIHPLNKKDVGKRLSLSAQKVAYGEK